MPNSFLLKLVRIVNFHCNRSWSALLGILKFHYFPWWDGGEKKFKPDQSSCSRNRVNGAASIFKLGCAMLGQQIINLVYNFLRSIGDERHETHMFDQSREAYSKKAKILVMYLLFIFKIAICSINYQ